MKGKWLRLVVTVAGVAHGIVFMVVSKGRYEAPIILAVVCFLAAAVTACTVRHKSFGLYAAAVVLNLPVAFYTIFWILWVCGLKLIPPPQM